MDSHCSRPEGLQFILTNLDFLLWSTVYVNTRMQNIKKVFFLETTYNKDQSIISKFFMSADLSVS